MFKAVPTYPKAILFVKQGSPPSTLPKPDKTSFDRLSVRSSPNTEGMGAKGTPDSEAGLCQKL